MIADNIRQKAILHLNANIALCEAKIEDLDKQLDLENIKKEAGRNIRISICKQIKDIKKRAEIIKNLNTKGLVASCERNLKEAKSELTELKQELEFKKKSLQL